MGGSTADCVKRVGFGVRISISIGDFFSVFVPARVAAKIARGTRLRSRLFLLGFVLAILGCC
jgi:hypothetical protein